DQASLQLENLIQSSAKLVVVRAGAARATYFKDKALNPDSAVPTFLGSVAADPDVYSHFFALANDEFLQVIDVAGDVRIQTALKAPEGTFYAVRRITRDKQGARTDRYEFFSQGKALLGRREQAATLVPTQRPWYQGAAAKGRLFVTAPYLFASTGELGLTVAAPLIDGGGVLATDISLRAMETFLARLKLPANGAIAVQDQSGHVLAFHGDGLFDSLKIAPMTEQGNLGNPYFAVLRSDAQVGSSIAAVGADGARFVINHKRVQVAEDSSFRITIWAPVSDFTAAFQQAQKDVLLLAVLVLLLLLPLAFVGSRQISKTLTGMAQDSERLKRLDFTQQPQQTRSMLYEIQTLGEAQSVMHEAIQSRTQGLAREAGAPGGQRYQALARTKPLTALAPCAVWCPRYCPVRGGHAVPQDRAQHPGFCPAHQRRPLAVIRGSAAGSRRPGDRQIRGGVCGQPQPVGDRGRRLQ
ncbi:MAG: hypothetical protein HXX19_18535, partial [Rhodoferax sp.]|nr:hypothetical protein [Rhodoferax sp.]